MRGQGWQVYVQCHSRQNRKGEHISNIKVSSFKGDKIDISSSCHNSYCASSEEEVQWEGARRKGTNYENKSCTSGTTGQLRNTRLFLGMCKCSSFTLSNHSQSISSRVWEKDPWQTPLVLSNFEPHINLTWN